MSYIFFSLLRVLGHSRFELLMTYQALTKSTESWDELAYSSVLIYLNPMNDDQSNNLILIFFREDAVCKIEQRLGTWWILSLGCTLRASSCPPSTSPVRSTSTRRVGTALQWLGFTSMIDLLWNCVGVMKRDCICFNNLFIYGIVANFPHLAQVHLAKGVSVGWNKFGGPKLAWWPQCDTMIMCSAVFWENIWV